MVQEGGVIETSGSKRQTKKGSSEREAREGGDGFKKEVREVDSKGRRLFI